MEATDLKWDINFELESEINEVQTSLTPTIIEPKVEEPLKTEIKTISKSNNPYYNRWAQILTNQVK